MEKTPTYTDISPRLGFVVSPVSDLTVFHVQYGRFLANAGDALHVCRWGRALP